MKNLISPTPLNCFLKALILTLNDSADALLSLSLNINVQNPKREARLNAY